MAYPEASPRARDEMSAWRERASANHGAMELRALEYLGARRDRVSITNLERGRIDATLAMIPTDVSTVLDVGCGSGLITERLLVRYHAVGVDCAYSSVKQVPRNGICANSATLPFRDRTFDLVLACEVLEHLGDELLRETVEEIKRTSGRYLLISVPYKERLRLGHTRCHRCKAIFHVWGHVRRFSSHSLDVLFAGWEPVMTRYYGSPDPYRSEWVQYVNQRLGNRWTEFDATTMCPKCGNVEFRRTSRNFVTIFCGVINLVTEWTVPTWRANWVLKLYAHDGRGMRPS